MIDSKTGFSDVYIMLLNVFLSTISTIGSTDVSVLKKFVFNRFSVNIKDAESWTHYPRLVG
ncbi:MAG: hypothetical protein LBQ23_01510 [Puniceicoccales bacterium]|jgi:hypothetical protein|nr:hypothetical protein [Puniceicoccales bacterium]